MTLASHDNGEYREITYGILQKCSTDLASVNVNALAEQILHIGAKFLWLKGQMHIHLPTHESQMHYTKFECKKTSHCTSAHSRMRTPLHTPLAVNTKICTREPDGPLVKVSSTCEVYFTAIFMAYFSLLDPARMPPYSGFWDL